ncbi:MAG TPA: hypothetical protein VEL76_34735 [Gemmataceae bacterium]|nr:hypothetical protein [Gemmataceae bacterium]
MPSVLTSPIRGEVWLKKAGTRNGAAATPAPRNDVKNGAAESQDAGPWEPTVAKLVAFQQLGDDWDGQGAVAPSYEQLTSAVGLAYTLYQQGVGPPSRVVPGPEGSVIFEWQDPDGTYTEVEQVRPFYAEVMVIEPGQPPRHWTLPTE